MQITAVEIPNLPAESEGWLAALSIQDGQAVMEGQLLARVEGKNFGQDLVCHQDGFVIGLHAISGQFVHSGEILCYISSQPSIPVSQPGPRALITGPASFDPTALIIFGGGGHGKAVIDLVRAMGAYRIVGIMDDGLPYGSDVLGVPVLGGANNLAEWHDRGIHLAVNAVGGIGNVAVRLKIFDLLAKAGFVCPTIVHPSAVIESSAVLEGGVHVLAQSYVGSAARIGFGSLINSGVIISHDCWIGRVVNLSPGATLAGNVRVEDHAQIGMRATVNVKITIGKGALLGNGCTVKADVPPGTRVRAGTIWPVPNGSQVTKP